MYTQRPMFILGFHGCDRAVRDGIVLGEIEMRPSRNVYDWLGAGFYFWGNNYERALQFANEQRSRGKIEEPAVLGAYIDLGNCLDLLESKHLKAFRETYANLEQSFDYQQLELPKNRPIRREGDLLLRALDCMVINTHAEEAVVPFDSVRGAFWEGEDLYPGAGMKVGNHIQICIRNSGCIKCFFIPRLPEMLDVASVGI